MSCPPHSHPGKQMPHSHCTEGGNQGTGSQHSNLSATSCYYFKEMLLPGNSWGEAEAEAGPLGKEGSESWVFCNQGAGAS